LNTLADAMQQFHAGDRHRRAIKDLEAEHGVDARLHASMILLDHVVEILRRSQPRVFPARALRGQFAHCTVRGGVAVQCDAHRRAALSLQRLAKERLRRLHIAVGAQAEVHGLTLAIDSPVKVAPLAANLHVRFVDAPRSTGLASESVPALLELGHELLHPSHDRRVNQRHATLGHHLRQVAQAQLVTQVPANTQNDDLALEVPSLEQLIHALQVLRHRPALVSQRPAGYRKRNFAPEPAREGAAFRTMDRFEFEKEFPHHARAVRSLGMAIIEAEKYFDKDGARLLFHARENIAQRIERGDMARIAAREKTQEPPTR
jgi:hypothetical protein